MTNSSNGFRRPESVFIVSPYAAHPGHYWNNAEEIALALQKENQRIAIFINDSTARPAAPEISGLIQLSPHWWRCIMRALLPGLENSPPGRVLRRPLETIGVLLAISRIPEQNRDSTVIHFIDGTFLIFFAWEFFAQRPCLYNLMGGTETLDLTRFSSNPFRWFKRQLTRWFLTACLHRNLLEFCAETEAVRRDWAQIVGDHVHVIPYAISPLTSPASQTEARANLGLNQNETILLLCLGQC